MKFKQKDSMKREDYTLHTAKLNKLDTLEKQIAYWCEHLLTESLFRPLISEDLKYELYFDRYKKSDIHILLANEINRLDSNEADRLLNYVILDSFYERYETEKNDLKSIKKHYLKEIKTAASATYGPLKFRQIGFRSYKGGDSIDIKLLDLSFIFYDDAALENFRYIYEGYLLAMAEREIKASEGQRSDNTISTNYLGLFIYAFDLDSNIIFNNLKMGPSEKAKIFSKVFNLGDSQTENLRKAISSPKGKVSKGFLKWFEQFDIDPKETSLKPFLQK